MHHRGRVKVIRPAMSVVVLELDQQIRFRWKSVSEEAGRLAFRICLLFLSLWL